MGGICSKKLLGALSTSLPARHAVRGCDWSILAQLGFVEITACGKPLPNAARPG